MLKRGFLPSRQMYFLWLISLVSILTVLIYLRSLMPIYRSRNLHCTLWPWVMLKSSWVYWRFAFSWVVLKFSKHLQLFMIAKFIEFPFRLQTLCPQEILGDGGQKFLQCSEMNSELSSQAEVVPLYEPTYRCNAKSFVFSYLLATNLRTLCRNDKSEILSSLRYFQEWGRLATYNIRRQ